jgi:spoIIIJ-associated protein
MQQDKIKELVEALFGKLGLDLQSVEIDQVTELEWYCNVESGDEEQLLGWHGDLLRSFQQIVKTIARAQLWVAEGEILRFDVGRYRLQQEENVKNMAEEKADEVLSTGRSVSLPPMSAYFRRLVHLDVAEKFPKLTSESEGSGSYRSVRISKK